MAMTIIALVLAAYYLFEVAERGHRARDAINRRHEDGWRRDLLHLLLALALIAVATAISSQLYLSVGGQCPAPAATKAAK